MLIESNGMEASLAGLTEQVKMNKKDNDKIKKSRSKIRAPVVKFGNLGFSIEKSENSGFFRNYCSQ